MAFWENHLLVMTWDCSVYHDFVWVIMMVIQTNGMHVWTLLITVRQSATPEVKLSMYSTS